MRLLSLFSLVLTMLVPAAALAGVKEKAVTLPDGLGSAVLYKASKSERQGPAVVVIHEWWGLNDYARSRAKMLAKEGYTAIAVDMYGHGKVADHPKDATTFMNAALKEPEKVSARFKAAMDILKAQKGVKDDKIFAIGYCFGGAVVLEQARAGVDLAGVASFHGSLGTKNPAKEGAVKAKVMVAHGGADAMVPPEQLAGFVKEMASAGVDLQLHNYPGVMHSFTNPGATAKGKEFDMPLAYDEYADKDSWAALMRFLDE